MRGREIQLSWLVIISLLLAAALSFVPLPDWLAFVRPALLPLMTLFWVLMMPRRFSLTICWSLGILLDVLNGTVLGEHALALVLCCFLVAKLSDFIRSYRNWQQTLLMVPVFLIYEFVLFWVDGLSGHNSDPLWRWMPVLSSALFWPVLSYVMRRLLRITQGV